MSRIQEPSCEKLRLNEVFEHRHTVLLQHEDKIKEKGANYTKASEPWGVNRKKNLHSLPTTLTKFRDNVEIDGHLITRENPNSARGVGEAILEALS